MISEVDIYAPSRRAKKYKRQRGKRANLSAMAERERGPTKGGAG